MKTFCRITLLVMVFGGSSLPLIEANSFFSSDEVVSIRLEAPISALRKQKADEPDWLVGTVILSDSEGVETRFNVQVRARGNFRRVWSTCNFPPFWLNFKKQEVKGTLFEGLDKVKIVTHCKGKSFEPYIHTEYLAYKTYNILTDRSFRVRRANIHYFDTDKNKDFNSQSYAAFFIEHSDSFEDRLNATQVKDRFIFPSRYDLSELCRAEMFQFFVGNTDFSFFISEDECCHNGKTFAPNDHSKGLIPVPYDFDMSGLVSAPYAEPNPNFPIYSVKERLYRGAGVPKEVLELTITHYLRKKDDIYELWEGDEFLDEKYKERAIRYIDKFYRIFENKKWVEREIIRDLRHIGAMDKEVQKRIDKAERKR